MTIDLAQVPPTVVNQDEIWGHMGENMEKALWQKSFRLDAKVSA